MPMSTLLSTLLSMCGIASICPETGSRVIDARLTTAGLQTHISRVATINSSVQVQPVGLGHCTKRAQADGRARSFGGFSTRTGAPDDARSPRLMARWCAKRLQRSTPCNNLIEHGVDRRVMMGTRLERCEILEVSKEGKADLCAHVVQFDIADHLTEYFHGTRSAAASVTDKSNGLVLPFAVQVVDRVFQRGGWAMIIFRGYKDESIELLDPDCPGLGVRLTVLTHGRRERLIQQGQVE